MTQEGPAVAGDAITVVEKDVVSPGKMKAATTSSDSAQTPANGVGTDAVAIPAPEEALSAVKSATAVDTAVDDNTQVATATNGNTPNSGGHESTVGSKAVADADENSTANITASSASDASDSAATDTSTAKDSDDHANSDTPAADPDELPADASVPKTVAVQSELKAEEEPQPVATEQEKVLPEAKEDEKSEGRGEEGSQPETAEEEPQPEKAEEELLPSEQAENPEADPKESGESKPAIEEANQVKSDRECQEQPQQQADNMGTEAQPNLDTDASTYAAATGSRATSEAAYSVEAEIAAPPGTVQALSRRLSNNSMGTPSTAVTPIRSVSTDKLLGPASARTTKSPVSSPSSQHDTTNTINVSQLIKSGAFKKQPLKDFVGYEELQRLRVEDGIDATRKEDYLNDDDFKQVFGVDREAFKKQPAWRQAQAKKKANLF